MQINPSNTSDENDMYDGPDKRAEYEFNRTKDPATGRVPREKYLIALQETIEAKREYSSFAALLNWIERGPTSDVYGPTNSNTRANNGIASGRIRAVMVDSLDPSHNTVWVGGVDGGLWKTTDINASPANWININDNLSNLAVAAICQDPRPGFQNIMYFCTGESYFNVDAVRGNGVFKSVDAGATWTYLTSTSSYVNGTRILCDYLGNIYLATRGTGLLRSTAASGGATWTNITPTGLNADISDMEITSTAVSGRLHVVSGIFSTQGYRYTDIPATVSGATWTAPATAFPSYAMRAEIACSGNVLYAMPADGTQEVPIIYKSVDGGANWLATAGQPAAGWASGQGWYALAADIDPSDPNTCIIGGLDTWKTTNGGTNWVKISNWVGTSGQYVHADIQKILWYDNGNKLIFACDGGIHFSTDKGTTIRDRNVGLRIKQFYSVAIHPSATNYFLAGAQDNGTHQFSNAGLGSTVEVTGGDGAYTAIDQNEPLFQFGSYVYNQYRRSTNGGATWSSVNLSASTGRFINPFDYDNTANIMYCADATSSFRRWNNPQTGSTSDVINISNMTGNVTAVSVSPYTANKVFFGTSLGKVVQVDGANTVTTGSAGTDLSVGLPGGTVSCINFGTDDLNLIMCESNYNINNVWISTNGGVNWTAIDGNLPNMPVRWVMFYPGDNSRAYIATETGVWETSTINAASTVWEANPTFPTVRTDMIKYRSSDRTIAAATHGRGLWTTTIPNVTTPDLQFESATASSSEATAFTSSCRGYTDYTARMQILNPPTGAATVTLAIAGGGTATQNVDYAITTNSNFTTPSMVLDFADGVNSPQPFTIRIYDDAAKENNESFTINYSVTGGNAQPGVSNQTLIYTINDNDLAPISAGTFSASVGTYDANVSSQTPFRSAQAKFRLQSLFTAAELVNAGITTACNFTSMTLKVVTKNSTVPYTGFTISMANTSATTLATGFQSPTFTTVYPTTNYSTTIGDNLISFSTPFAWDGTSNILVNYCFDNPVAEALSDITEGTVAPLGVGTRATTYSNASVSSPCTSSAAFISDARIKATFGTSITGTTVSTALNSSKNAYLGPNDDVYFYDASGNIMARIKNMTAFDYGCTQVIIDRAGSTSAQFWNNTPSRYLTSKSFKVIPSNNTSTGSYEITLYYTAAEVAGWQTATGGAIGGAQVVKISNGFYIPDVTPATPHMSDVTYSVGSYTTLGTNGSIMGSFSTTGFSGFAVGIPGAALPVSLISFTGYQKDKFGILEWKTSSENNNKGFELEKSYDGSSFTKIAFVDAAGNASSPHSYLYNDKTKLTNIQYYRLKQIDLNGGFTYSNTVVLKTNGKDILELQSVSNPFFSSVNMLFSKPPSGIMIIQLFDMNGRLAYSTSRMSGNSSKLEIGIPAIISSGSYILNIRAEGQQFSKNIIKQ